MEGSDEKGQKITSSILHNLRTLFLFYFSINETPTNYRNQGKECSIFQLFQILKFNN